MANPVCLWGNERASGTFHLLSSPGPSLLSCPLSYLPCVPQLPQAGCLWSLGPRYHCQSSSEVLIDSTVRLPSLVSHTRSSSADKRQYTPSLPPVYTSDDGWSPCQYPPPQGYPQRLPTVVLQSAPSSYPPALPRKSLVSQHAYGGPPVALHNMSFLYLPRGPQEFRVPQIGYAVPGFPGPISSIGILHEGPQTPLLAAPAGSSYGLGTSMPGQGQGVLGLGERRAISLRRLPDDVLGVVFSLTPWEHFGACGAVCGQWNRMVHLQANHNRKIAERLVAEGMQLMNTSNQWPKDFIERAVDICPQLASAALFKATSCAMAPEALECIGRAFNFQLPFPTQRSSDLRKLQMFAYFFKGYNLEAKYVLEEAVKWHPSDPELYDFLGSHYMGDGHFTQAIAYLDKALQLNHPIPRVILFKRAVCFISSRNPGPACEDVDKALSMCPDCPRTLALKNALEWAISHPHERTSFPLVDPMFMIRQIFTGECMRET